MIIWSDNLYFSKDIKDSKKIKIKKSIEKGKLNFEVYCITFASNNQNLFDIMNVNELLFPYYARRDMYITGIATSKEEAVLLVVDMLMEVYNNTGDFLVRDYF